MQRILCGLSLVDGALADLGGLQPPSVVVGRECFFFTHFPVRFNRKNRMVYVWRPKRRGGILLARWDDIYWHIRHNKNKFVEYDWFVAGHVMDKDRRTVKETFAFGYVGSPAEAVYPQWEYVRRYMEEGPEAVPASQVHLPIDGRREGFWWGAHMLLNVAPGHWLASLLLCRCSRRRCA